MATRPLISITLTMAVCSFVPLQAAAYTNQATPHEKKTVLQGLAPVSTLMNTAAGKAALAANLAVTGGIQTGRISQPTLLPFEEQEQQALRDIFITAGNITQLSDGLGSSLGGAYQARAQFTSRTHFTDVSAPVARVIEYATKVTQDDSHSGKFFFANGTVDGKEKIKQDFLDIYKNNDGTPDIMGKAYHLSAGGHGLDNSHESDQYGDSRPFQTEPEHRIYHGRDYFGVPATNYVYNHGPAMDLTNSPSYPSGHTTYGYTGAVLLAVLVPQRYQQMIARGAEYGNDRIIAGAHYAMDVLGGRTLAYYDMAHLLANDSDYLGRSVTETFMGNKLDEKVEIDDFQSTIKDARNSLQSILKQSCGAPVRQCAQWDHGRFSSPGENQAFYDSTQTYGLPVVYPEQAGAKEDINKIAPEAGYLLKAAFPSLSLQQANEILTETEGPGGGFLDNGSAFGVYSRINLYAAGGVAQAKVKSMKESASQP